MNLETAECRILSIEDNQADTHLMREALRIADANETIHLEASRNGDEAATLLSGFQRYDVILLDLSMPKIGGKEFLSDLKKHAGLFSIPIVIFTNSDYSLDIEDCRDLGAHAYFQKPNDFEHLIDFFSSFHQCLIANKHIDVPWISQRYTDLTSGSETNKFFVNAG